MLKKSILVREKGLLDPGAKALDTSAPIPQSFLDHMKSMGPGIVVVLTWLGAGDIVESAMAGGNYGYSLMWAFVLCLGLRYLFVSIIAKYQLCNPRGETVLAGLGRLHPFFALIVLVGTLLLTHGIGVFLLVGTAEICINITGSGSVWIWSMVLVLAVILLVRRPQYDRIEMVFFVLAGALSVSLIGLASWATPSARGIVRGMLGFSIPDTLGRFDAVFLMVAMVGAIAGSLGNLIYPYFMKEKGWTTPSHLRVQRYDLIFGIVVLIVLDLSIWIVGAEILHPREIHVVDLKSLSLLLGEVLGYMGTHLFYLGIFAALFSSMVGNGAAYAHLIADAYIQLRPSSRETCRQTYKKHPVFRMAIYWVVLSPMIWIFLGHSDFVTLTVTINAAQVIVLPFLVGGLWILTARKKYMGCTYRNRWWENLLVGFLFAVALISSYFSVIKVLGG